jgi:hypothetical protein
VTWVFSKKSKEMPSLSPHYATAIFARLYDFADSGDVMGIYFQ